MGRNDASGCSYFFIAIIAFIILSVVISINESASCVGGGMDAISGNSDITKSTHTRELIETDASFDGECVIDELDWLESSRKTGKALRVYFEKTGVQPYVVFKEYDSEIVSSKDKQAYTKKYFEDKIDSDNAYLMVYFCKEDGSVDDTFEFYYYAGDDAEEVMDTEASDILSDFIDKYWNDKSLSKDEAIEKAYTDTATRIMYKPFGLKDFFRIVKNIIIKILIGCVILIAILVVIVVIISKYQKKKEDEKETERILNTPLEELADQELDKSLKERMEKYDKMGK